MRVLVAEDDAITRELLVRALTTLGHDVEAYGDGEAAWLSLRKDNAPRVAILDWMMRGLSGPEICANLRASNPKHYTYLILLTARRDKRDIVEGLKSGADDYLVKPIGPPELDARLQTASRILGLEATLQEKIDELESMLHGDTPPGGMTASQPAAAPPADAGEAPSADFSERLAPLMGRIDELVAKAFTDAKLPPASDTSPEMVFETPDFIAYSMIVFRSEEVLVDLKLEAARDCAEALCKTITGTTPESDQSILEALGETLNGVQHSLRSSFEATGATVLLPFVPKTLPTADFPETPYPGRINGRHTCNLPGRRLRLTFQERQANIISKPLGYLHEFDVLADALYSPRTPSVVLLAQGLALNHRYIRRIRQLVAGRHLDIKSVMVVEASPLAIAVMRRTPR